MTLTELGSVEAGDPLGLIRYQAGAALAESPLKEGVAPKSSSLSAEDAQSYVVTDDMGNPLVALGLQHIHDGRAELGLESRSGNLESHVSLMRGVVRDAMRRNGIKIGHLDPELVDMLDVPADQWQQIGFAPDSSGHYTFTGA